MDPHHIRRYRTREEKKKVQRTGNAKECTVFEFRLDSMLDLAIGLKVDRGSEKRRKKKKKSQYHASREEYMTNVASSSTTTLQSFTSARARLSRDLSPTLRFVPSMTLSRL